MAKLNKILDILFFILWLLVIIMHVPGVNINLFCL
jgi:hypothetical protein